MAAALASSHSADSAMPPSAKMTSRLFRPTMPMAHQKSGRPMSKARSIITAKRAPISAPSVIGSYLTLKL